MAGTELPSRTDVVSRSVDSVGSDGKRLEKRSQPGSDDVVAVELDVCGEGVCINELVVVLVIDENTE